MQPVTYPYTGQCAGCWQLMKGFQGKEDLSEENGSFESGLPSWQRDSSSRIALEFLVSSLLIRIIFLCSLSLGQTHFWPNLIPSTSNSLAHSPSSCPPSIDPYPTLSSQSTAQPLNVSSWTCLSSSNNFTTWSQYSSNHALHHSPLPETFIPGN